MANEEQLAILKQGVKVWNKWREENPIVTPDLSDSDLYEADLSNANLNGVDLSRTNLIRANLSEVNLAGASISRADLFGANLKNANLEYAFLEGANFERANLTQANLYRSDLRKVNFLRAYLREANLAEVNLSDADLFGANLSGADLTNAELLGVSLVEANVTSAKISNSAVYGISVWDLEGEFREQKDLIITRQGQSIITVDNIEVAQFVYLILNNRKIRDVINTLTSKTVLILGRFALPERKTILDALRDKLREYDLLPIVFDFDRPTDKDFTETIKTLAGISYFVIADITNPKSSPLELQATVPDYQVPFVPIIKEGESPFAMMVDLQKKYPWVLPTVTYDSMETLIKILKPLIIDPAMKKRNELRLIKAQVPEVISGKDFLDKEKE